MHWSHVYAFQYCMNVQFYFVLYSFPTLRLMDNLEFDEVSISLIPVTLKMMCPILS